MFNFNNLPEQREFKKGKFIRPGIQDLYLKDIELQTSNAGDKRPVFHMETEPITEAGWEGHQGAKGQIGKIAGNFNYYIKTDEQAEEFACCLRDILKATDRYDVFIQEHSNTQFKSLEEMINGVLPYVKGTKARYFVAGEQYQKLTGDGIGIKLKFPSKKMVEPAGSTNTIFPKFDESNKRHFQKLDGTAKPNTQFEKLSTANTKVDDLPF